MNRDEQEIDLRELLAECLIHWKRIAFIAILCAALGLGYAAYKNTFGGYDRQVAAARAELDEDEVSRVDALYAEHAANLALQEQLAENASRSIVMQMSRDDAAIRQGVYAIETDQDYLVNNLGSFILDDAFYQEAAEIFGDGYAPEYLSGLFGVWKGSTGATGDSIAIKTTDRNTSVYYLRALAYNEDQANALLDLMEERLQDAVANMQDVDANIKVTNLGRISVQVDADTITNMQTSLINSLASSTEQLQTADEREISPELSKDEQAYYDLLIEDDDVKDGTEPAASYPKMLVLGGIAGLLLALVILFVRTLLIDQHARSLTEIETGTGFPTLAVYDRRTASKDPLVRTGMRLQTGDAVLRDENDYHDILTTRIQALMSQNKTDRLFIYDTQNTLLQEGNLQATYGLPESSQEAMQQFLNTDAVILVIRMGETLTADIARMIDLCKVHDKQILGNVVIYGAGRA